METQDQLHEQTQTIPSLHYRLFSLGINILGLIAGWLIVGITHNWLSQFQAYWNTRYDIDGNTTRAVYEIFTIALYKKFVLPTLVLNAVLSKLVIQPYARRHNISSKTSKLTDLLILILVNLPLLVYILYLNSAYM